MPDLADECVELIVTSPPYPMIELWDRTFRTINPDIRVALAAGDGSTAFELMHMELDRVWRECYRVLKPGCIACINIGDATRTVGDSFQLYPNHSRVIQSMCRAGFTPLPDVLWRKPTNSPTKFMGSGMLPSGAYVTYEHEYVLIFRKGPKRLFPTAQAKLNRRRSAFFWEERNAWFSDVWTDLKGVAQELPDAGTRRRSAAFPFDLPYRLIQMYSVFGDTVLDPFAGTGTSMLAAVAAARNSIGIEIDASLARTISATLLTGSDIANQRIDSRMNGHGEFVQRMEADRRILKYRNRYYGFPVMTSQEVDLLVYRPVRIRQITGERFEVQHEEHPGGISSRDLPVETSSV